MRKLFAAISRPACPDRGPWADPAGWRSVATRRGERCDAEVEAGGIGGAATITGGGGGAAVNTWRHSALGPNQ
jgi:hypothetical protein